MHVEAIIFGTVNVFANICEGCFVAFHTHLGLLFFLTMGLLQQTKKKLLVLWT